MTFDHVHRAQSRIAQVGGKRLGTLLWWSLNGNRVSHDRLVDLAARHGLDERYLPSEIKPTQAFRRAWRHASSRLPRELMLRQITEAPDAVVVGLVRERPDTATQDLDYDLVSRITFNKGTHRLLFDSENEVTGIVTDLYRHHLAHTTEDIRGMMTTFLREAGVSLREAGGVYFVPASHQGTLDALCAVVQDAGSNATYTLPIVDTPEGKATLRDVAKRTLDSEIQQLQQELAKFDHEKVRDSTLERKLDGFDDLRSRVQLFSRVLSFKAGALNKRIEVIQTGLRRQLQGEPTPVPEQEPPTQQPEADETPYVAEVGF